jgi:predicted Zn-ribbon and HTH transcriptional regulator
MTMAEHDKKRIACPKCKSRKVEQQYGSFFTVTSKKS